MRALLKGVSAIGANMNEAELSGMFAAGVDFSYACLEGAKLGGSKLGKARLANASLNNATSMARTCRKLT